MKVLKRLVDRLRRRSRPAAGSMFVGAVDEVELGRQLGPEGFDPEEVPSEHPEINELRKEMPFG